MKNLIYLISVLITIAIVQFGCSKGDSKTEATPANSQTEGSGSLSVRLTDAPANYTKVNVQILRIEIQHQDTASSTGGWDTLATNSGIYDLLELRDSISVLIANNDSLPIGRLNQMRLILGDSNSVVIDTVNTYSLETPSAQHSGLKLNVNAEIRSGVTTEILLDFDAEKSIVEKGNGDYSLKPVIKVLSVVYK